MLSDIGLPVAVMTPANLSRTCLENTNFVDFFGNDCKVYYYNGSLCRNETAHSLMTPQINQTAHPRWVQGGATARQEGCACKMMAEDTSTNALIFETANDLSAYSTSSVSEKCMVEIMFGHVDLCVGQFSVGEGLADDPVSASLSAVSSHRDANNGRRRLAAALSLPAARGQGAAAAPVKTHVALTSELARDGVGLVFRPPPRRLLLEVALSKVWKRSLMCAFFVCPRACTCACRISSYEAV